MSKKLFFFFCSSILIGPELKVTFPRAVEIEKIRFMLEQKKREKAQLKKRYEDFF